MVKKIKNVWKSVCNHCGRIVEGETKDATNADMSFVFVQKPGDGFEPNNSRAHLCPECTKRLESFLNGWRAPRAVVDPDPGNVESELLESEVA